MADRVVFECNVYFQALVGTQGPAAACLQYVADGTLTLYTTEMILEEVSDVCLRPKLAQKFGLTENRLQEYLDSIRTMAILIEAVPHVFHYQRDPKDERRLCVS